MYSYPVTNAIINGSNCSDLVKLCCFKPGLYKLDTYEAMHQKLIKNNIVKPKLKGDFLHFHCRTTILHFLKMNVRLKHYEMIKGWYQLTINNQDTPNKITQ